MNYACGNGCRGGSSSNHEASNSDNERRYKQLTSQQLMHLEEVFQTTQYPSDSLQKQISEKLEIDHLQVKFWFQNRRTKDRKKMNQTSSQILKAENEMIQNENAMISEALRVNPRKCPSCGVVSNNLEALKLENAQLNAELDQLLLLALNMGVTETELIGAPNHSTIDASLGNLQVTETELIGAPNHSTMDASLGNLHYHEYPNGYNPSS